MSRDTRLPWAQALRPPLRVVLLGGFRVERAGETVPDPVWTEPAAKALTKLLATHPSHTLHRRQVIATLWPGADAGAGLHNFGRALRVARLVFEPGLRSGETSAYLRLRGEMLALDTNHVTIDADRFQQLAEVALRAGSYSGYETALAAYGGELLPEDRDEHWCTARRTFLSELQAQLVLGLAETFEKRRDYGRDAVRKLRLVLDRYDSQLREILGSLEKPQPRSAG